MGETQAGHPSPLRCCRSAAADAANYQGTITNVAPLDGKVFIVVQSGNFDGAVSQCISGNAMVYWVDPATPFSRTLVALRSRPS